MTSSSTSSSSDENDDPKEVRNKPPWTKHQLPVRDLNNALPVSYFRLLKIEPKKCFNIVRFNNYLIVTTVCFRDLGKLNLLMVVRF
jgi:hypothetical protein